MCQHEGFGTGCIDHACLSRRIQFAPSGAFAVEQLLPSNLLQPLIYQVFWHTLAFKVVEIVVNVSLSEVSASFFNGVAIGDAVESDRVHGEDYGD